MEPKHSKGRRSEITAEQQELYSRFHSQIYFGAIALWLIAHLLIPDGWSIFWLMVFWGVVVLIHYLTVRCMNVDDAWVKERTDDIGYNASDLSHIESIRKGFENRASRRIKNKSAEKPSTKTEN